MHIKSSINVNEFSLVKKTHYESARLALCQETETVVIADGVCVRVRGILEDTDTTILILSSPNLSPPQRQRANQSQSQGFSDNEKKPQKNNGSIQHWSFKAFK